MLRNPKPLVVGIGWVVECVEQRKRIDETNFLVDLEDMNVAGIVKVRYLQTVNGVLLTKVAASTLFSSKIVGERV